MPPRPAPPPVTDLLTGESGAPGEPITLGAWDVRIFRSGGPDG